MVLHNNQLSGPIPSSLGSLTNLESLVLHNNQLSGPIPSALCRFEAFINPQLSGDLPCAGNRDSEEDRAALVELYNATNGVNWRNNTNWNSSAPLNEWVGVSTDGQGRAVVLDLGDNGLSGSIPSSLGSLTNLEELDLGGNSLSGSIPPSLGNLTNLEKLSLHENGLSGSIPPSLGSLANLEKLSLHDNQLSGSIPSSLGSLTNLEELDLGGNSLSGSIPSSLGSLTNLEELALGGNGLSDSIPSSLGGLTNLTALYLHDNQLSGLIPSFLGSLTNLGEVWLHRNQLSGSIPSSLGNLSVLGVLSLGDNQLTGPIPATLGNLDNLVGLGLENNQLTEAIPSTLGDLHFLQFFLLSGNRLSGSIPSVLCGFEDTINPQQGGANLPGCVADSEEDRAVLVEFYNATNGPNWADNTNWNSSESLYFWYGVSTNHSDRVESLLLPGNQLSGSIPSSLGNLTRLRELSLDDNQLSGSIPSSLGSLAELELLYLRGNRLSGSIPAALCKFSRGINPQQDGVILPCAESGAVGAVEVRLVAGDGRLTVDWTPASGGSAATVDGYDVRYRVDGGPGAWTELPDGTKDMGTGATIGGLTNGTAYEVQVRAVNAAGDGVWSAGAMGTPVAAGGLSFGDARIEDQRWRQYAAIPPLVLPAASGGAGAVTYGVSPALPAGLEFDEASRTVSGAPRRASAAATYEYTAADAAGATAGLSFTIEVEMSAAEAALRRDALAAQGRALLSSVTGVIGERLRPRSRPSAVGAGRGGAVDQLGDMLASLLGYRAGAGFGAGGAGFAPDAGRVEGFAGSAWGLGAPPSSGSAGGPGGLSAVGSAAGMGGPGGLSADGSVAGMGGAGLLGGGRVPAMGGLSGFGAAGGLGGLSGSGSFEGLGGRGLSAGGSAGAMGGLPAFGAGGLGGALPALGLGASGVGLGGWDGPLWGQSFSVPLSVGGEGGAASRYTVWGAGDVQSFSGSPEAGRYSGDMRSLYVGADGRLGYDWLAGAAVGRSWGSADYTAAVDGALPGRLTTLLTGVYPYVRGAVSPGLEVWAIGGYGRGSAADARADDLPGEPGDLTMTMGAAGLRRDVAEAGGVALAVVGGAGALSLSSSGGGLTVSGLGAGVHQGRVALEAARATGAVSPFVQVGGRYDGGDGETGAGLELVGGVRASTPRVDLEARGRWLSVHTASGYSEYGAMARLSVKSRADGTGVRAALSPRWGLADELSVDGGGLLDGAGASPLDRGGAWASSSRGRSLSLDGELGYGWRARRLRGIVSPLTSYRRTGFGGDLTQVGLSYQSWEALRGDVRMQFTLGREQWLDQGAGYRLALSVLSVF